MRPFAVAAVQMDVYEDRDNLPRMRKDLDSLMRQFPWVQMVVFSELAACGQKISHARPLPGPEEEAFGAMAREYGVWLIPGSLYERCGDKVYNTTSILDPGGNLIGRYRKMFPFLPYEPGVEPGTQPFVFDVPGVGRFGVSICYDLWFPETIRWLVSEGAEVVLHPSLTETIDRDLELSIVRASAAQHQCYIVDVNGVADGGNGRSIMVGPGGDVLYRAGRSSELIPLELDLDRVSRTREVGIRGLGQPLKSFRDRKVEFPHYAPGFRSKHLESLGELKMAERGSRAGIESSPLDEDPQ